jgi:hypothetical protein
MRHAKLAQRNGVPYTRDEIAGMQASNRYEREMGEALGVDEPVIEWVLDPRRRVMVAAYVYDPHPDGRHNGTKTACKRGHPLNADNIILDHGHRRCRTCKNERRKAS